MDLAIDKKPMTFQKSIQKGRREDRPLFEKMIKYAKPGFLFLPRRPLSRVESHQNERVQVGVCLAIRFAIHQEYP